jgi:hypothetical protein
VKHGWNTVRSCRSMQHLFVLQAPPTSIRTINLRLDLVVSTRRIPVASAVNHTFLYLSPRDRYRSDEVGNESSKKGRVSRSECRVERAGKNMKRKITIIPLGAVLLAFCSSATGQQSAKVPRIGYQSAGSSGEARRHFARDCVNWATSKDRTSS